MKALDELLAKGCTVQIGPHVPFMTGYYASVMAYDCNYPDNGQPDRPWRGAGHGLTPTRAVKNLLDIFKGDMNAHIPSSRFERVQ